MCGRGRLFPDTEQPPQNAPHAAGRTPHHDFHALTSCHASTPRRRRSAETPPETSGTPPETRRRSGCPVPAPARRSPETSFRRHIVARYIPPLLQYMKERTRRAWRAARRCFLSFRVCRGGRLCPPCMTAAPCRAGPVCPAGSNAYAAAGHTGPALQGRCVDAVPYTFNPFPHPPSKSQQFPAEFCAPIQNVKISPETVANVLRRCYI